MNAPIQSIYQTGQTLYAILISPVNGFVWNQMNQVFESYNSGHWSQYAIVMAEYSGSGYYRAAYPIAAPSVLTTDVIYVQGGGSPTLGDTPAANLYQSQGSNIGAVGNLWQSAQNMSFALGSQQIGSILGTPSTAVLLPTNLTNVHSDAYAGRVVIMTSGALIQQASPITAYDGVLFTLTIVGFPSGSTPSNGDTFIVI